MSYDLFFIASETHGPDEFAAYFADRPCYELSEFQAWYSNDETGVYFSFDLTSQEDEQDRAPNGAESWASFNLNFFRPSYFADEAGIELEAFISRFGTRVSDPQNEGMGEGDFSVEGFRRGWNHGNTVACHAIASREDSPELIVRPTDELRRIWQWNYNRARRQENLGDHVFVPRVVFCRMEGRVCTGSVWGDGVPVVLPKTDLVIVYRDELAPRRWFKRQPGTIIVPWEEVEPKMGGYRAEAEPILHYFVEYSETPEEIVAWIKNLAAIDSLEGVAMDKVLDAELFDARGEA